jgi:RNA polymerase sigma factor (sigma-70 family)
MLTNQYPGMVQPEVTRLIISRARRYGINRADIDDLQQQIVPVLAKFQFDPARANGASPTTVMTEVIDRQIKAHLRAKHRYQKRIERLQNMTDDPNRSDTVAPVHVPEQEHMNLRIDLQDILAQMTPRDREVCQHLSHGLSVTAIAAELGCGRDTVGRAVARIRQAFEAAGLRAWIDPEYDGEQDAEEGGEEGDKQL